MNCMWRRLHVFQHLLFTRLSAFSILDKRLLAATNWQGDSCVCPPLLIHIIEPQRSWQISISHQMSFHYSRYWVLWHFSRCRELTFQAHLRFHTVPRHSPGWTRSCCSRLFLLQTTRKQHLGPPLTAAPSRSAYGATSASPHVQAFRIHIGKQNTQEHTHQTKSWASVKSSSCHGERRGCSDWLPTKRKTQTHPADLSLHPAGDVTTHILDRRKPNRVDYKLRILSLNKTWVSYNLAGIP